MRADLKELLEVPLDGAPYGYTPFCSSRPEMEGFRYWIITGHCVAYCNGGGYRHVFFFFVLRKIT